MIPTSRTPSPPLPSFNGVSVGINIETQQSSSLPNLHTTSGETGSQGKGEKRRYSAGDVSALGAFLSKSPERVSKDSLSALESSASDSRFSYRLESSASDSRSSYRLESSVSDSKFSYRLGCSLPVLVSGGIFSKEEDFSSHQGSVSESVSALLIQQAAQQLTAACFEKIADICVGQGCTLVSREGECYIARHRSRAQSLAKPPKAVRIAAVVVKCWSLSCQSQTAEEKDELQKLIREILANTLDRFKPNNQTKVAQSIYMLSGENLEIDPFLQWLNCKFGRLVSSLSSVEKPEQAINGLETDKSTTVHRVKRALTGQSSTTDWSFCTEKGGWQTQGGETSWGYGYSMVPADSAWTPLGCNFSANLTQTQMEISCADKLQAIKDYGLAPSAAFIQSFKAEVCKDMTQAELQKVQQELVNCGKKTPSNVFKLLDVFERVKNIPKILRGENTKTTAEVLQSIRDKNCKDSKVLLAKLSKAVGFCEGTQTAYPEYTEALDAKWQNFVKKVPPKYSDEKPDYCNLGERYNQGLCSKLLAKHPDSGGKPQPPLVYFNSEYQQAECLRLMQQPLPTTTPAPSTTLTTPKITTPALPLFEEPLFCQTGSNNTDSVDWAQIPDSFTCDLLSSEPIGTELMQDIACADAAAQLASGTLRQTQAFDGYFNQTYCWKPADKNYFSQGGRLCEDYKESLQSAADKGASGFTSLASVLPESVQNAMKRAGRRGQTVCELIKAESAAKDTYCQTGRTGGLTEQAKQQQWQALKYAPKKYGDTPPVYCQQDLSCYLTPECVGKTQSPESIKVYQQAYQQAACLQQQAKVASNLLRLSYKESAEAEFPTQAPTSTLDARTLADNATSAVITTPASATFNQTTGSMSLNPAQNHTLANNRTTDQTTSISNDVSISSRVISGVSCAATAGLTLIPTLLNEKANFTSNKQSCAKLTQSGLRLLSASALTVAPFCAAVGCAPAVGSVAATVGTAAMVAQAPFVIGDLMRFICRQDKSFQYKGGGVTQYCHENTEADTGGTLAANMLRIGTQAMWTADNVMKIFGPGFCTPIWMSLYLPTLYGLLTKTQMRAFDGVSFDESMLEQMAAQHLPALLALIELVQPLNTEAQDKLLFILQSESRVGYQLGGRKLADKAEIAFLESFFDACQHQGTVTEAQLTAIKTVIGLAYQFDMVKAEGELNKVFTPEALPYKVLACLLELRVQDKAYRRNARGCVNANHVYSGMIASVMKLLALKENQQAATQSDDEDDEFFDSIAEPSLWEDPVNTELIGGYPRPSSGANEEQIELTSMLPKTSHSQSEPLLTMVDELDYQRGKCASSLAGISLTTIPAVTSGEQLRRDSIKSSFSSETSRLLARASSDSNDEGEEIPLHFLRSCSRNESFANA